MFDVSSKSKVCKLYLTVSPWLTKQHIFNLDIPVGTLLGPSLGELHTVGHVRALVKEPTSGRKLSVPCWAACNGTMLVELCRTTDQWRPRAATYRPLAEY